MGTDIRTIIIHLIMIVIGLLVFTVAVNRYWVEKISGYWSIWLFAITIGIMQPLNMTASSFRLLTGNWNFSVSLFKEKNKEIALQS